MKSIRKYLSLIAILPLLTSFIAMGSFIDASAVTKSETDRLSPKAFNLEKVCGDQLCSEINKQESSIEKIEVIDIFPLSGDFYKILIKVDSSQNSVINEKIFVSSDIDLRMLSVPFIKDNSHDYAVTTIKSTSAEAIKVDYEPYQMIPNINFGMPQVEVTDISNISDDDRTYRVIFEAISEQASVKNIEILITSDADSLNYTIGGLMENNSQTNQVIMKVINPESVSVQIVDFEVNR